MTATLRYLCMERLYIGGETLKRPEDVKRNCKRRHCVIYRPYGKTAKAAYAPFGGETKTKDAVCVRARFGGVTKFMVKVGFYQSTMQTDMK